MHTDIIKATALGTLLGLAASAAAGAPTDTTLSYQGEIREAGEPVSGSYDLAFSLWDTAVGGSQVGSTQTLAGVPVENGRFTVSLDFAADAFDNSERWLAISVNTVTLDPRQPITRTPYAIQTRGIHVDADENVGLGVTAGTERLRVWNLDPGGEAIGAVSSGRALVAISTEGDMAILGSNQSAEGRGTFGQHSPSGNHGYLGSADHGVYGWVADRDNDWAGYFFGSGYFSDQLFVGREEPITQFEHFGVKANVEDGYGGMYMSTRGNAASPFYGYAPGDVARAWHYLDGSTGHWHLNNGGTNRLTVESGGRVGIGTGTPGFLLHVNGSAGKPGGGSWSNASDRRLKKKIESLDGALDRLLALRGVTYEYIDPAAINELAGTRTGMIAQEVEAVFPDWVDEAPDGYKRLTFRGFEALVVEAMRELAERDETIEDLETRLAALERKQRQDTRARR